MSSVTPTWSADFPFWLKHFQFLGERVWTLWKWFKSRSVRLQTLSSCNFALNFIVLSPHPFKTYSQNPETNLTGTLLGEKGPYRWCGPQGPHLFWWGTRGPDKTGGMETWSIQLALFDADVTSSFLQLPLSSHCKSQCSEPSIPLPILWLWTLMYSSPFWISLCVAMAS